MAAAILRQLSVTVLGAATASEMLMVWGRFAEMKTTKFIRSRVCFFEKTEDGSSKLVNQFESINQAKKESHKIQMCEDGALGRGSVQIV